MAFNMQACREPHIVESVVALIVITVSLVGLFITGCISCFKLQKMAKLNIIMKWLFYSTFIFSLTSEICHCLVILLCQFINYGPVEIEIYNIRVLHITLYMMVLLSLISTLIARLHFSFRDSIYGLSNLHKTIFILLMILLTSSGISSCLGLFLDRFPANFETSLVSGITYTIATGYSVTLFAYKLMKLVNIRAASVKDVMDENAIKLNKSQTKFIAQTSKYLSLLGLATLSSIITVITLAVFIATQLQWVGYVMGIHISMDTLVNMILLYLQYPFAKHYYDKYCKWSNKFWTMILMTSAERSMQSKLRKSVELHQCNKVPKDASMI